MTEPEIITQVYDCIYRCHAETGDAPAWGAMSPEAWEACTSPELMVVGGVQIMCDAGLHGLAVYVRSK